MKILRTEKRLLLLYSCGIILNIGEAKISSRHRRAIVNGRVVADPSDAQFFARSGKDGDNATPDYLCGATLVHNDILLTAAHCQGSFNYGVFLYDPYTNDYTKEAAIDFQIRYPDFNGKEMHNDVLLLRLATDPGLPIAKMNSDDSIPTSDNRILKAYGFGKTDSEGPPSDALMEGYFSYIDNQECSERVRSTSNSVIWDDILCADPYNENGSSVCQGDSGGPLMDSSGTLTGIVSWNFRCKPDLLPDGFARVSFFHDWIREQICFHSRIPLASNNTCPYGTSPPLPESDAVQTLLTFDHDFYPEETFFRVLSKNHGEQVAYAGPKYVPSRESAWTSRIYLLPGEYTFEILDWAGNGLSPGASGSDKKGSWKLIAFYEEDTEVELASGGANFLDVDLVDFVVDSVQTRNPVALTDSTSNRPSQECLETKWAEVRSLGLSWGIVCNCVQDTMSTWALSCVDTKTNSICAANHDVCGSASSLECCGDRRCSNGRCRLVSQGRDDKRIPLLAGGSDPSMGTIRGAQRPP